MQHWTRRRTLVAGAGLLTAACAPQSGNAKQFRMGYQKNGVSLVAKRKGTLDAAMKAAGVEKMEWTEFTSGVPLLEALRVGSIDMGSSGDTPPIFAQVSDDSMMYVAAQRLSGKAGGVITPKNSKINSIADLRGKKVSFARGTSAHNSAFLALQRGGLSLDQIEHINLPPADAASAFAQGGIDGWVIWDPFYTDAIRREGARVLISLEELGGGYAYFFANKNYVAAQPELVKAALNALASDGKWCEANRGEVAAMMAEETGLDLELMKDTTERADFALLPMSPDIIANQQQIADRFADLKIIPNKINIADAVWTGWTGAPA
jgi:aliphatic sulfonates family ABC transporter substrate-binding protein